MISDIRQEIDKKVLEFISEPDDENKIFLIPLSQGAGKSVTTAKALLENDKKFIWLSPSHKNVDNLFADPLLSSYNVFHLKGRKAKVSPDSKEIMCENPLLEKVEDHNLGINEFLCEQLCGLSKDCKYKKQFITLNKTGESWAGVYQFVGTKFLENYPCDCIVFDENPLSGLQNRITFNTYDLDDLYIIITKIYDKLLEDAVELIKKNQYGGRDRTGYINFNYFNKCYGSIIKVINTLKYLLKDVPEKGGLSGKLLIDAFTDKLGQNLSFVEDNLNNTNFNGLFFHYKNELYSMLEGESGLDADFKNIFYDVIRVAEDCIKYKDVKEDINFSTLLKHSKKNDNSIIYYNVIKELPDKHIIILDATGDKEVYQNIFGREVIVFNPSLDIKRNIIQITDGFYPKKSFYFTKTRLALYKKVRSLITHWVDSDECKKVFIFTHKGYSTIENETKDYSDKSIEKYLKDCGMPFTFYEIRHYGAVKGLNLTELMRNGKLIIIGTPEPNIVEYLEDVRAWYVGGPLIINDRIIEPKSSEFYGHNYRCKDERYMAHIRMGREHQLEHAIERIRFTMPNPKKLVILWTMLPIGFETIKMSSLELMEKFVPDYVPKKPSPLLNPLSFIRDNKPTKTEFCKNAQNWKFTKGIGGVKRLQDKLIDWNLVETHIKCGKTYLKLTTEGKTRLDKIIHSN